ncbi:MAG: hypothetical protein GWP91_09890 [Rhodobacterales bacterium]|nr:hypothetical protein [Rhodobacterales bacterium]
MTEPALAFCEAGPAALAFMGVVCMGTIHLPDPTTGLLAFSPKDSDLLLPDEGAPVRIASGRNLDHFQAVAEVVDCEDEHSWVLSVPRPIPMSASRRAFRHRSFGEGVFGVNGRPYDVYDIHSGGVGLVVPPGKVTDDAGRRYAGTLRRSDGPSWEVLAETSHLRRHPEYADWRILGCRLLHEEEKGKKSLSQILKP